MAQDLQPLSQPHSPEPPEGYEAPSTQLPTPNSSPPFSPNPNSAAGRAWLLSTMVTTAEELARHSIPPTPPKPIFNNDFFEVRSSPKKGLGAFASVDIPKGTIIMAEEPLFRTEESQIFWTYDALSDEQKRAYKGLSCWFGIEDHRVPAIFTTNRFETGTGLGGIFLESSRFNHACHPYSTCTYRWDEAANTLTFTTLMDINNGEEITISYTNRPKTLYRNYGFDCDCPGCSTLEDFKEGSPPGVVISRFEDTQVMVRTG
ncbi:SET domain-containing protein [Lachnellula hyalina]|uniref:SET domain-containing protein n=1 Tax=Lachnellula hyalina TaxID=1316788 RepID=A0A8H8R461_9HELO|nr:SET domain-containing protein [Lachnellula hyalina]TVY28247.1 SET domain-containing protein [Lachnellula hyalina]